MKSHIALVSAAIALGLAAIGPRATVADEVFRTAVLENGTAASAAPAVLSTVDRSSATVTPVRYRPYYRSYYRPYRSFYGGFYAYPRYYGPVYRPYYYSYRPYVYGYYPRRWNTYYGYPYGYWGGYYRW
jgi:hypothetical protein